jgi:hypothetical protein
VSVTAAVAAKAIAEGNYCTDGSGVVYDSDRSGGKRTSSSNDCGKGSGVGNNGREGCGGGDIGHDIW